MKKFQINIGEPFVAGDGSAVYRGLNSANGPYIFQSSATQEALPPQARPYSYNYHLAKGVSFPLTIPPLNVPPELVQQEIFARPVEAPEASWSYFTTVLPTNQRYISQSGGAYTGC